MRKYVLFTLTVIFMLLVGCASMKVPSPGFDVDVIDGEIDSLEITTQPVWLEDSFSFSTTHYEPGIGVFLVKFDNKSNELIKILWEESSITYDGSSYVPFLAGQKYVDAGSPASPTIIPKNTSILKEVHSSGQVKYSDGQYGIGWYTTRIAASKSVLIFCFEKSGSKKYITVEIRAKNKTSVY